MKISRCSSRGQQHTFKMIGTSRGQVFLVTTIKGSSRGQLRLVTIFKGFAEAKIKTLVI